MAEWFTVDLVFEEPASADALKAANAWLHAEDYDAPRLTAEGWRERSWRSPLVDLPLLPTLLARFGLVCRMRFAERYLGEETTGKPWHISPRMKPLTIAEAAEQFAKMGGSWTGEEVAAALRAMAGK